MTGAALNPELRPASVRWVDVQQALFEALTASAEAAPSPLLLPHSLPTQDLAGVVGQGVP